MYARIGPAGFPSVQMGLRLFQTLEADSLQRGFLGMSDAGLDLPFSIGIFDIRSIPALQQGGTMLALSGDEEGLAGMLEIVASLPELEPWIEEVERHQENLRLFKSIQDLAKKYGVSAVEDAAAAALELHVHDYRFVRRYLERRPPLTLRQVDPLIRELTQYRDLINLKIQEQEQQ